MFPVTSSNISSIGYDTTTNTLVIKFHSGGLYQYSDVPATIYQGLMSASSHGQYFHRLIKNVYPYRKIG
ncbi:KTSC domain-containing protein [Desulfotomaculum sp. 1211_IL3151]|uniref:KTSC domain-containing protein n=1 Tax=Desulfotomaculum sp. 1211_IL3151 TaxID=3084055 RepID=UPI002FD927FE